MLSIQQAGYILLSQPLIQFLLSPFTGRLSDLTEPRIVASIGMGLNAAGLALLVVLGQHTRLDYIICTLILLGLGFALFSSPNANAMMSSVDKKFYGVASATGATMRVIGQMLSMGIVMMIIRLFLGRTMITFENSIIFIKSMKVAFTVFAVLCVLGAGIAGPWQAAR